jgi:nucleotide-binding universal stress UspA family protein
LVIAVDGSPAAEAAVREVAARTWPLKSEARVIVVDEPLVPTLMGRIIPPVARWIEESNLADREWVKKIAEASAKQLRAAELIVTTSIKEGDPKRVLVEEAERWGADCIFLGSTGFSNALERFMLGSVSAAVAARAHCSVEVVRYEKTEG